MKTFEYFPVAQENACVKRFQVYLDTGYHNSIEFNRIWDMLAWLEWNKNK
jgi:hypothetical protein